MRLAWRVRLWATLALLAPPTLHRIAYRLTGGLVGCWLPGLRMHVLLLTTTGRRSGRPRTTPVLFLTVGEAWVIVASNRGRNSHPGWYWNLKTDPRAIIQIGRHKLRIVAEEVGLAERHFYWPLLTDALPCFEEYQKHATRELPIMVLRPKKVA